MNAKKVFTDQNTNRNLKGTDPLRSGKPLGMVLRATLTADGRCPRFEEERVDFRASSARLVIYGLRPANPQPFPASVLSSPVHADDKSHHLFGWHGVQSG